jgi:hypothetical protein
LDGVRVQGSRTVLPAVFDVTGLAAATVTAATVAAAELLAVRPGAARRPVTVDRRAASAAFVSEALFTPIGWQRPAAWDPVAGDYRGADGWIRLHTNYAHHRSAAERVLDGATDRETVAARVSRWPAEDLESAIVEAGGCAAVMHTRSGWLSSGAGQAAAAEPMVRWTECAADVLSASRPAAPEGPRPFSGLRVLDLTRVIAGPVATRFLAAYGADVLRIDPPGFDEVAAVLPETTAGKRTAWLDLTSSTGRYTFDRLVAGADVVVSGLRPDALAALGYGPAQLRAINPGLVIASLDAYGWDGPWHGRRGFDSLVQMSCGIAAAGAAARGQDEPAPLPAQALDHGTGYLLAAAIGRALSRLLSDGVAADVRCSLVGTAELLIGAGPAPTEQPGDDGSDDAVMGGGGNRRPAAEWSAADTVPTDTVWGPARRVPLPGQIAGIENDWTIEAGPLGRHQPEWPS